MPEQGQIVQPNQPQVAQQSTGPSVDAIRWAMQDPDRAAKLIEEYETEQEAQLEADKKYEQEKKTSRATVTSIMGIKGGDQYFSEQLELGVPLKEIVSQSKKMATDNQKAMTAFGEQAEVTLKDFDDTWSMKKDQFSKSELSTYNTERGNIQKRDLDKIQDELDEKQKQLGLEADPVIKKYQRMVDNLQILNEVRSDTFNEIQLEVDDFAGTPDIGRGPVPKGSATMSDNFSDIIGRMLEGGVSKEERKELRTLFKKFREHTVDGSEVNFPNINVEAIKQSRMYDQSGNYKIEQYGELIFLESTGKGLPGDDIISYLKFLEKLINAGAKRLAKLKPWDADTERMAKEFTGFETGTGKVINVPTKEQLIDDRTKYDVLNIWSE